MDTNPYATEAVFMVCPLSVVFCPFYVVTPVIDNIDWIFETLIDAIEYLGLGGWLKRVFDLDITAAKAKLIANREKERKKAERDKRRIAGGLKNAQDRYGTRVEEIKANRSENPADATVFIFWDPKAGQLRQQPAKPNFNPHPVPVGHSSGAW